ncbi:Acyl-CoA N-acyltransferase with RING/FYVE/PHD-type zinc finger protein [Zea mays]|uniref:Acyl-CoA N-acyltransferase with RING/FYVE/PHD-type zinc finger protein n=1 Tax=Zea mays TaxID=4577 RepID=A0A1D6HTA0_MAIZE|nr:Acyl-CoA N-acyltransferase with RING/FYVE/PHD-type zinc finger protein [Zea mays]ONM51620.1 Acyl-CoA N-acyltransferase with RING/FYVE/PHD-type zinc finger protein [Zea mays]
MGSDREGRGSEAVAASKPRKRQLVMESSDSEADEFCISTRQNASGAASLGNAGVSSQGSGDRSEEKPVTSSPEKLPGVKSSDVDGSDKKTGVQLESSSSQPAVKRIRVETVHGDGNGCSGGASKCGTGGKMLPRGLPAWRFERPEVRGGRVLDDKGGVSMKASSASKMKEQVSSLGDKRQAELQKHERRTPLKTDQGKAIDSGQQEVLRLQGKRGVLRILPKNDKVTRDTGDGKILSRQTEVDEETGNGRIPTKRGVLKLLPKNNGAVMESNECKLLSKKVKVDEETGDDKMPMKKTKVVDKETSDGKILAITTNLDAEFGGHKLPMKNCTVDMETVAGKFQQKNSKADGETKGRYKGYEEKSGAPAEFQKHDANGEKRVLGKLLSPVALRKSDPSVVGVSLGQRMKQQNSKQQLKNYSLSLKDDSTKSSEQKNLKKRLLEHKGSSESLSKKAQLKAVDQQATSGPVLNKLEKKPRGGPLNKHKQDLRNKIKHVLLDNGWKIDLRQRKNKDYEDSVYVSPTGTGYWSITKAYAVFQEQFQNMGRSSKLNNTKPGASDAISKDDLALLKKNIVKRRTNKEICGAEKKPGVSRNRSSKDILANRDFRNKHQNKEDRVKIKDRRCGLLVRGSTHDTEDNMDGYIPYEWKRTLCSWMIDLGVISEDMHVKYMNSNRTREMLAGKITREGIFCGCCSKILTIAKFELHAGSKEKKPYANIFLEGGKVSLLQCLLDAWEKHTQSENKGFYKIDKGDDEHDDTCAICGDGGDLVCCDHCASTFHLDCLGIKVCWGFPLAIGIVAAVYVGSVVFPKKSHHLLLSYYFLVCNVQGNITKLVHLEPGQTLVVPCLVPLLIAFAVQDVERDTKVLLFFEITQIYKRLNKLLGIKNHMEAGFSWSLVHCFANDQAMPNKNKEKLAQCNSKTALAFTVLDECFQPHIDDRSGINMIHNVAYNCGSDFSRLDFSGFYAFILERGDEVIAAASVRGLVAVGNETNTVTGFDTSFCKTLQVRVIV